MTGRELHRVYNIMPVNTSIADYIITLYKSYIIIFPPFGFRRPSAAAAAVGGATVRHRSHRHHHFLLILSDGCPLGGPQPVQFSVRRKIK